MFNGDIDSLIFVRGKINEDFKKYKHIQDPGKVEELVKFAAECEHELTTVVQLVEKSDNHYGKREQPHCSIAIVRFGCFSIKNIIPLYFIVSNSIFRRGAHQRRPAAGQFTIQ